MLAQESANPKPVVAVVVVTRSNLIRVEVRIQRVACIARVGRTRPQVAVRALVVEPTVPVASKTEPPERARYQYHSLYCTERTGRRKALAALPYRTSPDTSRLVSIVS
jgi:hypothetical protein